MLKKIAMRKKNKVKKRENIDRDMWQYIKEWMAKKKKI